MFFLELQKLESNSGRAKKKKSLAVEEYVILICISGIVSQRVWDVSSCDCRSGSYCGRGGRREKIVLNLSLPFQSVCMFLFIILQFLSTYAIIKFPDPCLAVLTRHWEIYSHCRSFSLMCSLPPSLPPSRLHRLSPSENLSVLFFLLRVSVARRREREREKKN